MPDHRLLQDWVSGYLQYTERQESPESLHMWTGMAMISAAIRRNLWIEHEYYTIYPNLYVIIVAESARVRKSTAMNLGRDILLDAIPDIVIMRDSMTSQGLIHSLNHKIKFTENGVEKEELRSNVIIHADEIANLFSYDVQRAKQMVIYLTRTYESPAVYDHTTARDRTVRLFNNYPVLIGGSDPVNLKTMPEEAIGGLTGRLIFVLETERRHNNPGWKRDDAEATRRKLLREYLIHDLQRIARLRGEIKASKEAMDYYDDWYRDLSGKDTKDPDTDAFYNRCHTTALKLAIVKTVSESDSMDLNIAHIKWGIVLVEAQLPLFKRVRMWKGHTHFEQNRAKLLQYLQSQPRGLGTRRKALDHLGISANDFDQLLLTLIQAGKVEVPKMKVKNETVLILKEVD